jgi:TonB-linked SusC/RagA family outer membrane protein
MTEGLCKALTRAVLALALLAPVTLAAQATGAVRGEVMDAVTGQPLVGAQVQVVGTRLGSLTNAEGGFLLLNVPVGEQTLRVTFIGYQSADETVTVQAGGTAAIEFSMTQSAIALDEIIVTGTAGRTEKRSMGNTVSTIQAEDLTAQTHVSNVSEMLTARTPGVTLMNTSGQVGTSARVRVRGAGSISAGLEPVYYVDGVRVRSGVNDGYSTSNGVVQGTTPLDAINPNDIQSIEVIKGPAAATLYGAEAAGGVIQIITKKGNSGGDVQWTAQMETGSTEWALDMPTNYTLCTVPADAATLGMSESQFNSNFGERIGSSSWPGCDAFTGSEPLSERLLTDQPVLRDPQALRTGNLWGVYLSGRGGGENYNFYISGDRNSEEGVYYNNYSERTAGRANFGFVPSENLNINLNTSYTRTEVQMPIANNGSNGILRNGFRGRPGRASSDWGEAGIGWHGFIPEVSNQYDNTTYTERTILALTTNYEPFAWFQNRLTVGMDKIDRVNEVFFAQDTTGQSPWGSDAASGSIDRYLPVDHLWTVDYQGTISTEINEDLTSNFSGGLQMAKRTRDWNEVNGWGLLSNSLNIVGAAENVTADQGYEEQTSLGFFFQEQMGWKDRLFGTLALRIDDNTAFGQDFELVYYPKASVSWVISEESFFALPAVEDLKLRAAWGMAGNAPGPGQADRTFQPGQLALGDAVVNRVYGSEYGNSELKAETGQEFEIGFDASFLDGRLGAEFTYYNQRTKDALIEVPDPPSSGFSGVHLENIGEIANSGIELLLTGSPIYRRNVQWDATLTVATNSNELISFGTGSIQEISFGSFATNQKHIEGYPLGGYWVVDVERDENGVPVIRDNDGIIVSDPADGDVTLLPDSMAEYLGPALPTLEVGFSSTLTLFNNLRLYGLLDYKGGNYMWCAICSIRSRINRNTEEINDPDTDPAERLVWYSRATAQHMEEADFIKLRELSATYTIPSSWAQRFGASQASITLSGRNLWMWTKYFDGFDPEVVFNSRTDFTSADYASTPMTRRLVASVRFVF